MPEIAKPNRKALQYQMVPAEFARLTIVHNPERGTAIQELLHPEYWANVARDLRVNQAIAVISPDGEWEVELRVLAVGPFTAKVAIWHMQEWGKAKPQQDTGPAIQIPDGYDVRYRGRAGWSVVRQSDGNILKDGLSSKGEAAGWLDVHLKTFAA